MFLFLLFLFPTLVSIFIGWQDYFFLMEKNLAFFFIFRSCYSFIFLNTLPYFFLFTAIKNKKFLICVSFVRYFYVFIYLLSFTITGHIPNASVLLSCFDTNFKEAIEFFINIPFTFYFASLLYWSVFIILLRKVKPSPVTKKKTLFFSLCCFLLFAFLGIVTQSENNLIERMMNAYKNYRSIIKTVADINYSATETEISVTDKAPSLKRTVVIMIGESETAAVFNEHIPQFSNLLEKDGRNLILVPKAETNAPQTLAVLKDLFLHSVKGNPDNHFNLLNIYRQNGYKTFWLSNHHKQGKCDDFLYAMTRNVSYRKYYNFYDFGIHNVYGNDFHDEILVDGLKETLADPAEKKIVFLHLFGSHNAYQNRYPDDFHSPLVKSGKKKTYSDHEHYRNAAAYTNTVLAKIIHTLAGENGINAAVYFSDHGDDPANPTFREYEKVKDVPLFFWLSNEYQKQFPKQFKNLSCLQDVYFANLPYIFNQIIGVDINDISASPEIKACFEKEE